jgi:hypothetical protein
VAFSIGGRHHTVLDGIDLDLRAGHLTALVGASSLQPAPRAWRPATPSRTGDPHVRFRHIRRPRLAHARLSAAVGIGCLAVATLAGCSGSGGVELGDDWAGSETFVVATMSGLTTVLGVDPDRHRAEPLLVVPQQRDDDSVLAPQIVRLPERRPTRRGCWSYRGAGTLRHGSTASATATAHSWRPVTSRAAAPSCQVCDC